MSHNRKGSFGNEPSLCFFGNFRQAHEPEDPKKLARPDMEERPCDEKYNADDDNEQGKINPVVKKERPLQINEICEGQSCYKRNDIGEKPDFFEYLQAMNRYPEEGNNRPDYNGYERYNIAHGFLFFKKSLKLSGLLTGS